MSTPTELTSPEIALAIHHHHLLNDGGRQWARLEMIQLTPKIRVVRLDIGNIRLDGVKEIKIATRHYLLDTNGEAYWYEVGHP